MLDYLLDRIHEVDEIDEIHVVTNHKFAESFTEWAYTRDVVVHDDGTTSEDDRLGAIGDIQFVVERAGRDDDLIVIAGDNLFDYSLEDFVRWWRDRGDASAVVLYDIGDLELDEALCYVERRRRTAGSSVRREAGAPDRRSSPPPPISTTRAISARSGSTSRRATSPTSRGGSSPGCTAHPVYGIRPGRWFDIGTPETLAEAAALFEAN